MPVTLSTVKPDYNSIVVALQTILQTKDSWKDLFPGATGETLIEFISGVTVFQQFAIEQAFKETFLTTARRPTSIYAIARMLGVRVSRKLSSTVEVTLIRPTTTAAIVLPMFSSFTVDGKAFTNTSPIVFNVGVSTVEGIQLAQGTVGTITATADGTDFFEVRISGSEEFSIHDSALTVKVNGILWEITRSGLWRFGGNDEVVYDSTYGNGDLSLVFGSDEFGRSPSNGDTIIVEYLDNTGTNVTELLTGSAVVLTTNTSITGLTTTNIQLGGDEKTVEFYRQLAPHIFFANQRAVTTPDYRAISMTYPGVIDAFIRPQKDINPFDLRNMNLIFVTLLLEQGGIWDVDLTTPNTPTFAETSAGFLPIGNYSYRVSAINEAGETLASVAGVYTLTIVGALLLRWDPITGAKGYRVYGRTSGSELFIKQTEDLFYLDTGVITPSGALPVTNTTLANFFSFQEYMTDFQHDTVRLIQANPVAVESNITINMYVSRSVQDIESLRTDAFTAIRDLFTPRIGLLGRKIALSDITKAARVPLDADDLDKGSQVDYIDIVTPTSDLEPLNKTQYLWLKDLTINAFFTDRLDVGTF